MSKRVYRRKTGRVNRNRPARVARSVGGLPAGLVTNPSGNTVVPYNFRTQMPYGYTWANTTVAPGFYDWVIRGGSIYDPDYAIGGDSVYGFDQMMAVWDRFKVLGSTIKVFVTNLDASNPLNVAIFPTTIANSFGSNVQDAIMLRPGAKNMTVDRYNGTKTLSNSAVSAKIMGVRDLDDEGYMGDATHDPAHNWYWHIIMYNNGAAAANAEIRLSMLFDTVFSNPHAMTV